MGRIQCIWISKTTAMLTWCFYGTAMGWVRKLVVTEFYFIQLFDSWDTLGFYHNTSTLHFGVTEFYFIQLFDSWDTLGFYHNTSTLHFGVTEFYFTRHTGVTEFYFTRHTGPARPLPRGDVPGYRRGAGFLCLPGPHSQGGCPAVCTGRHRYTGIQCLLVDIICEEFIFKVI